MMITDSKFLYRNIPFEWYGVGLQSYATTFFPALLLFGFIYFPKFTIAFAGVSVMVGYLVMHFNPGLLRNQQAPGASPGPSPGPDPSPAPDSPRTPTPPRDPTPPEERERINRAAEQAVAEHLRTMARLEQIGNAIAPRRPGFQGPSGAPNAANSQPSTSGGPSGAANAANSKPSPSGGPSGAANAINSKPSSSGGPSGAANATNSKPSSSGGPSGTAKATNSKPSPFQVLKSTPGTSNALVSRPLEWEDAPGTGNMTDFQPFVTRDKPSSSAEIAFQHIYAQVPYDIWSSEEIRMADYFDGLRFGPDSTALV
ncbi:hypothetical protein F4678DRAFT_432728 [Xylaria arbuscula]|nr:hypothetical protein F4678DRAFT_432728 [Xylaria arbuscula]